MDNILNKKYEEIGNFIQNAEFRIQNILSSLNWNETDTKNEKLITNELPKETVMNPTNNSLDLDSQFYPESIASKNSFKLNQKIIHKIINKPKSVPENVTDYERDFTRQEKLKIYEFIISKTKKLIEPKIEAISNENRNSNEKGKIVLKSSLKKRTLKNRVTKAPPLSLNEELRNLIDIQMESYLQHKVNQKKSADLEKSTDNQIKSTIKKPEDQKESRTTQSRKGRSNTRNLRVNPMKNEKVNQKKSADLEKSTDNQIKSTIKKPEDQKEYRTTQSRKRRSNTRNLRVNPIKNEKVENSRRKDKYVSKERKRSRSFSIDSSDRKSYTRQKDEIKNRNFEDYNHKTHKKHKKKNKKHKT